MVYCPIYLMSFFSFIIIGYAIACYYHNKDKKKNQTCYYTTTITAGTGPPDDSVTAGR